MILNLLTNFVAGGFQDCGPREFPYFLQVEYSQLLKDTCLRRTPLGPAQSVRFTEVSVKRESTVVPRSLPFRSLERERNGKREILGSRLE